MMDRLELISETKMGVWSKAMIEVFFSHSHKVHGFVALIPPQILDLYFQG